MFLSRVDKSIDRFLSDVKGRVEVSVTGPGTDSGPLHRQFSVSSFQFKKAPQLFEATEVALRGSLNWQLVTGN
jgi:hypothetical protein